VRVRGDARCRAAFWFTSQAAFMFYTVSTATPLAQLMNDALIMAHQTGHDVYNALDIFENSSWLKGE
jgi:glycylpeptide N-tetradecanoyltransferase